MNVCEWIVGNLQKNNAIVCNIYPFNPGQLHLLFVILGTSKGVKRFTCAIWYSLSLIYIHETVIFSQFPLLMCLVLLSLRTRFVFSLLLWTDIRMILRTNLESLLRTLHINLIRRLMSHSGLQGKFAMRTCSCKEAVYWHRVADT